MGRNQIYWQKRKEMSERAKKHANRMNMIYAEKITESIQNLTVYDDEVFERGIKTISHSECEIILDDIDSVSAICKYNSGDNKIAVLNFASYKEAGGMFLEGSTAQEESLCHASTLYNVLSKQNGYYEWNNRNKNRSLYLNRALYTPQIVFFKDYSLVLCDVITCAAPNKYAAQKYQHVTDEENYRYLRDRIRFVLNIAAHQRIDTLILGAFGCGVFVNSPEEVANIFYSFLEKNPSVFKKVVFAIPDKNSHNYLAFKNRHKKYISNNQTLSNMEDE